LWLQQALATEVNHGESPAEPEHMRGHHVVDVAIVGGGFTGLWTALELSRRAPGTRIALLEADICGAGASGRNGGFAMTWWSKFTSLQQLCGTEAALELGRRSSEAVAAIGRFCGEHGIDDAFADDGWMWAATNPAQVGSWRETVAALSAAGAAPLRELDGDEAAALGGSPVHLGGVFDPTIAAVQPAVIARTLAKAVRAAGVEVHERTPVRVLEPAAGGGTRLRTAHGTITASQVVLALNAWAAKIPELGRGLVVVASDVIVTAPVPDELDRIGLRTQVTISDSRRLVNYYRRTAEGRLMFGRGGGTLAYGTRIGANFDQPGHRTEGVRSQLRRIYPTLWDVPIEHAWSGPIDYSLTGLPFLVRLQGMPNVLAAAGFSGDGVGPSRLVGELLAQIVADGGDAGLPPALTTVPHTLLPPEPIRYLGGRLVRAATARKEQAEDLSLTPSRATRLLAALDPTTGGHAGE
jgi:glycine/D-amino acid oxidase-like deaminating enzyme